jgi:hypothetical protein
MFSITQLIIGVIMVGLGVLAVKYTFQLVNMTGRQEWIENITGSGSTYGVFKLFGVALILIGLLVATGFGNEVLNFIFAPLRRIFTPPAA